MGFNPFKAAKKVVKKVLKSDVGKAALLGLGAYYGPGMLGGGKGFGGWKSVPWSTLSPWKIGALTAGGTYLESQLSEEEEEPSWAGDADEGHQAYLRYRKYFPFGEEEPIFQSSQGGRVKAQTGMYTGNMAGRAMGQGLGSISPLGNPMGDQMNPQGASMARKMDPRMAQQAMVQTQTAKPTIPQASSDAELIQLIKMLSAMGIPMEQLRGRTKEELVEMLVAVSGKTRGGEEVVEEEEVVEANTGGLMRTGYALGTEHPIMPSKDGMQLDMRDSGGYQPLGKAEKHDDVRALLAQGEFVMTSDAVKGLGAGDREMGAKKMYNLMHNMEAMA